MIITPANLRSLRTGFSAAFQAGFTAAVATWDRIATRVPSTSRSTTYGWLGQLPTFRQWLGDRVVTNLAASEYVLTNVPYESTVGVDRDDIEDDTYGVYRPAFEMLGQAAKVHPNQLVFRLLQAGFTTLCYDGQPFFSPTHPVLQADGSIANVSNSGGGAGTGWYLLDTSKPIKPLLFQVRRDYDFVAMDNPDDESVFTKKELRYGVDARVNAGYALWQLAYGSQQPLDATSYAAGRAALMGMAADGGAKLNVLPTLLVVPPSLEAAARNVVGVATLANGSENPWYKTAEILVSPYLS